MKTIILSIVAALAVSFPAIAENVTTQNKTTKTPTAADYKEALGKTKKAIDTSKGPQDICGAYNFYMNRWSLFQKYGDLVRAANERDIADLISREILDLDKTDHTRLLEAVDLDRKICKAIYMDMMMLMLTTERGLSGGKDQLKALYTKAPGYIAKIKELEGKRNNLWKSFGIELQPVSFDITPPLDKKK